MSTSIKSIPLVISYEQLIFLLREYPMWKYPVVTEENEFLGLVKRNDILHYIENEFIKEGIEDTLPVLLPLDFIVHGEQKLSIRERFSLRSEKSQSLQNKVTLFLTPALKKSIREITKRTLDLRTTHGIAVNPSAYRVSEKQPITEIYALMDLLRCPCVYVVSYGVLVGVLSRQILAEFVEDLNHGKKPLLHSGEASFFPSFVTPK